jgi:hypothetical protein
MIDISKLGEIVYKIKEICESVMALTDWATLIAAFAALASVLVALVMLYAAIKFHQIANLPDFFRREYTDKHFNDPRTTADGTKLKTLRDARYFVQEKLESVETREEARSQFIKNTKKRGLWENKFANELSIALEQVGAMVLAGAIPLRLVLALNGYQIIEDWGYCRRLVEDEICGTKNCKPSRSPILKKSDEKNPIFYHRRHGKWLAYAAIIYMSQNYKSGCLNDLISAIDNGGIKAIRTHEKRFGKFLKSEMGTPIGTRIRILILLRKKWIWNNF